MSTEAAPADWPQRAILEGSPPKEAIFVRIHSRLDIKLENWCERNSDVGKIYASLWSMMPKFSPEGSRPAAFGKPKILRR